MQDALVKSVKHNDYTFAVDDWQGWRSIDLDKWLIPTTPTGASRILHLRALLAENEVKSHESKQGYYDFDRKSRIVKYTDGGTAIGYAMGLLMMGFVIAPHRHRQRLKDAWVGVLWAYQNARWWSIEGEQAIRMWARLKWNDIEALGRGGRVLRGKHPLKDFLSGQSLSSMETDDGE